MWTAGCIPGAKLPILGIADQQDKLAVLGTLGFSTPVLKNYAKNLTPNQRRIANFWQDGLSTYTPPGHWNRLAWNFC